MNSARLPRLALALACLLWLAAAPSRATLLDYCCACVPDLHDAHGGGSAELKETQAALFCAEAASGDEGGLEMRCDAQAGPTDLVCYPNTPGPSCRDELAGLGIICPTAGAPAAAPLGLLALAAALAGLGVALLARRVRRA
ncbi:MAG: hypothetical protein SF182_25350 [Deltaproteobacteria bacterium]|nr:hypothetical protein [Deltaproteobacteria bacterium]